MDRSQFQEWLSSMDWLSPEQKQQAQDLLLGEPEAVPSLDVIEARMAENRQCPHCDAPGAVSRGRARGLRRYQCKACKKTFNATTGTPLQGLHNKDRWLTFGGCLSEELTLRASAKRCDLAVSTAFRWRHRFLGTKDQPSPKPKDIVEANET